MVDMENVIKGLECCANSCSNGCPYADIDDDCQGMLCKDAISLLKEQEDKIRQLRLALQIMNGNGIRVDTEGR